VESSFQASRVLKRVQGERIARIAWKLTRGLYFLETSYFLPDDTPHMHELIEPDLARELAGKNAVWEEVKAQPPKGAYGGVFEYKYFAATDEGKKLHAWGMLLWDRLMLFVSHHHPSDS